MSPTLPGDLPGLLRRGSPVRDADDPERIGVVVGTYPRGEVCTHWTWGDTSEVVDRSRLLLDLSDATGRAHAAWWLAGWYGLRPAATWTWRGMWDLDAPSRRLCFGVAVAGRSHLAVPALADLDPLDDTRLPDGSRWVDAEALRRVCLHVAGRRS